MGEVSDMNLSVTGTAWDYVFMHYLCVDTDPFVCATHVHGVTIDLSGVIMIDNLKCL